MDAIYDRELDHSFPVQFEQIKTSYFSSSLFVNMLMGGGLVVVGHSQAWMVIFPWVSEGYGHRAFYAGPES